MMGRVILLFGIMTGLLMLVGYAIGSLFGSPLTAVELSLAMALFMNLITYLYSDKIVLSMCGARIVSEAEYPRLHRIVERVANAANIPKPKVAVIDSNAPNAFATGRGPGRSVVAVTRGLMSILNEDEIEAVIGHEITHIKNRDILVSTIAATLAGAISYLAFLGRWGILWGTSDRRRDEGSIVAALLAAILAPIAATLVQLAISREREYGADEGGAKITGKPMSLANALIKISGAKNAGLTLNVNPSTSHMWIVNPLRGSTLEELFSTHPPVEKRVERLKKIAREMGIYYM
jgi:heat shock protein HtpX